MRKAIIQTIAPAAGTLGLLILAGSWELAEAKPVKFVNANKSSVKNGAEMSRRAALCPAPHSVASAAGSSMAPGPRPPQR